MKTQIITLARHDDLISVRDRMSWAKSPRILLIWPAFEQVALRPLDLRVLHQHAATLGARMGIVTRRGEVRRDAEAFGIPVFRTTAEAQKAAWPRLRSGMRPRDGRRRQSAAQLRAQRVEVRRNGAAWASTPAARIVFFALGVVAVMAIVSLFVPRATVELAPISEEQSISLAMRVNPLTGADMLTGEIAPQEEQVTVTGTLSRPIQSLVELPKTKATGTVEFRNLTSTPLVIPAGTIVYSLIPSSVRFATRAEAQLAGGAGTSVEVPIEAAEAGKAANLPANAINGIEGHLSASASVTNELPTSGGASEAGSMPTQADREELRASLLQELADRARQNLEGQLVEGDVIVPGSLVMTSVEEESFDPPVGQPGSVLSLSLTATYRHAYVRGADLRRVAEIALDGAMPQGYAAQPGTLVMDVTPGTGNGDDKPAEVRISAQRRIRREIDLQSAAAAIRGRTPAQARAELQTLFPLASPPLIRLAPSWWPRLPLIPFRIEIVFS